MSKGDFKRVIENIYINTLNIIGRDVNTCIAPNIYSCSLLISMNSRIFLTSGGIYSLKMCLKGGGMVSQLEITFKGFKINAK